MWAGCFWCVKWLCSGSQTLHGVRNARFRYGGDEFPTTKQRKQLYEHLQERVPRETMRQLDVDGLRLNQDVRQQKQEHEALRARVQALRAEAPHARSRAHQLLKQLNAPLREVAVLEDQLTLRQNNQFNAAYKLHNERRDLSSEYGQGIVKDDFYDLTSSPSPSCSCWGWGR